MSNIFNVVSKRFNSGNNEPENKNNVKSNIPDNLFFKCPRCRTVVPRYTYRDINRVCPNCNYHGRLTAPQRISLTVDKGSFKETDSSMLSCDPINFPDYTKKQQALRETTGLSDAIITGEAMIRRIPVMIGAMDTRYMMASMGSVVGEKITRTIETATRKKMPVIMFTASGGARMQEGIISLMQMAKTSAAVAKHNEAGQLYITVMTDPTTGGVTASFASLGDIIIAEPKVLVGFAGRRVIEGTIKQRLPDDFQLAEFLLEKGFVDMIVERKRMRSVLSHLMKLHGYKKIEDQGDQ